MTFIRLRSVKGDQVITFSQLCPVHEYQHYDWEVQSVLHEIWLVSDVQCMMLSEILYVMVSDILYDG